MDTFFLRRGQAWSESVCELVWSRGVWELCIVLYECLEMNCYSKMRWVYLSPSAALNVMIIDHHSS